MQSGAVYLADAYRNYIVVSFLAIGLVVCYFAAESNPTIVGWTLTGSSVLLLLITICAQFLDCEFGSLPTAGAKVCCSMLLFSAAWLATGITLLVPDVSEAAISTVGIISITYTFIVCFCCLGSLSYTDGSDNDYAGEDVQRGIIGKALLTSCMLIVLLVTGPFLLENAGSSHDIGIALTVLGLLATISSCVYCYKSDSSGQRYLTCAPCIVSVGTLLIGFLLLDNPDNQTVNNLGYGAFMVSIPLILYFCGCLGTPLLNKCSELELPSRHKKSEYDHESRRDYNSSPAIDFPKKSEDLDPKNNNVVIEISKIDSNNNDKTEEKKIDEPGDDSQLTLHKTN